MACRRFSAVVFGGVISGVIVSVSLCYCGNTALAPAVM